MKIKLTKILNTCLSGFVVAWAFMDGAQATIDFSFHRYVGAIVLCGVELFLVVGIIWRDYLIQRLIDSLYERKDFIEQQAREIIALQHIALSAIAIETAVEHNMHPNIEPLKQCLDAYGVMRSKANVKPN